MKRFTVPYSITYDGIAEVEAEDEDGAEEALYLLGDEQLLWLANKEEPTITTHGSVKEKRKQK